MKTPKPKPKPQKPLLSLNEQYDYITLKTPNGNFTINRNGSKMSGKLSSMPGAFAALNKYVDERLKVKGMTYGKAMKELTDPKLMTKLVPGWDDVSDVETFKVGDTVEFVEPLAKKSYPGKYEVAEVKRTNVFLWMDGKTRRVGVPKEWLHNLSK